MEIHDGITAFNLCPAMDQGFRCLKCVPRGSTVRHWSSTPHNNDGTALEWPCGVTRSPTSAPSWIGASYHQHVSPTLHHQYWMSSGWRIFTDLRWAGKQRPSDLIPLIKIKHGFCTWPHAYYLIGTLGLDCQHWTALPVPLLHQMPLCIYHPVLIQVLLEHASETSKPARKRG